MTWGVNLAVVAETETMAVVGDTPGPWVERRACGLATAHLFYPPPFELHGERRDRHQTAQAICATCPVRTDCFNFAATTGEANGIWGGVVFDRNRHQTKPRNTLPS